jgi:hypothetical protein
MPGADPNDNDQVDSAPNNRTHNDGKQWAQDLVLEEIGRNNNDRGRRTRRWILAAAVLVVVAGGVVAGVVLSQRGDNRDETAAPSSSSIEPSSPNPPPSRRPIRSSLPPTTEHPTDEPTLTQTLDPTARPTLPPTTSEPTAAAVMERFMNGLPRYSLELASANASSPQAKALAWLQNDTQYNEYQNVHRLNQRYALAVFYYSTNGDSWKNNSGWLSNASECTWYTTSISDEFSSDLICGTSTRLRDLFFSNEGLEGSLPTELELLSDLDFMSLHGDGDLGKLSVAIYPEL